jgi:hypothetical protein
MNMGRNWLGRQDSNLRMPVPKTTPSHPKPTKVHTGYAMKIGTQIGTQGGTSAAALKV